MPHVLQHLREGGWRQKALQPRLQDMVQLQQADETSVTDKSTMTKYSTRYCKELFGTRRRLTSAAEAGREAQLQELIRTDFVADPSSALTTVTIVTRAFAGDVIVTEMWQPLQTRSRP